MDDLKLYAESKKQISDILKIIRTFSTDTHMDFRAIEIVIVLDFSTKKQVIFDQVKRQPLSKFFNSSNDIHQREKVNRIYQHQQSAYTTSYQTGTIFVGKAQ